MSHVEQFIRELSASLRRLENAAGVEPFVGHPITTGDDIFWALRTLRTFIQDEIETRSSVGDDQAEYRDAPREAYAAFTLLRNRVLRDAEDTLGGPPG